MGFWLTIALLVLLLPVAGLALASIFSPRPPVGLVNGRLRPCPPTPNCVCSHGSDDAHLIAPLPFAGDSAVAWEKLKSVLAQQPGVAIVAEEGNYLHAEATTRLFRFVDDLEFLLSPEEGVIHMRSASRAGKGDFGVNRHRLEEIRARFRS